MDALQYYKEICALTKKHPRNEMCKQNAYEKLLMYLAQELNMKGHSSLLDAFAHFWIKSYSQTPLDAFAKSTCNELKRLNQITVFLKSESLLTYLKTCNSLYDIVAILEGLILHYTELRQRKTEIGLIFTHFNDKGNSEMLFASKSLVSFLSPNYSATSYRDGSRYDRSAFLLLIKELDEKIQQAKQKSQLFDSDKGRMANQKLTIESLAQQIKCLQEVEHLKHQQENEARLYAESLNRQQEDLGHLETKCFKRRQAEIGRLKTERHKRQQAIEQLDAERKENQREKERLDFEFHKREQQRSDKSHKQQCESGITTMRNACTESNHIPCPVCGNQHEINTSTCVTCGFNNKLAPSIHWLNTEDAINWLNKSIKPERIIWAMRKEQKALQCQIHSILKIAKAYDARLQFQEKTVDALLSIIKGQENEISFLINELQLHEK